MKYMGGKSRIAKQIATYINNISLIEGIDNYYEPFCGGCAVAEQVNIKNRYCSDANKYLIALMNKIKTGIGEYKYVDEDTWRDVKANIGTDKYEDWYTAYVGIICSFRGLWFQGHARDCVDKDYSIQISGHNSLLKEQELLKNIIFNTAEYDNVVIENNSIVYCDAPYIGTNGYMTGKFDFSKYYDWLKEISKNNLVLVSEYIMPHGFKEVDSWIMNSGFANGLETTTNHSSVERLFVVDGGHLVDKYFSMECVEYLL